MRKGRWVNVGRAVRPNLPLGVVYVMDAFFRLDCRIAERLYAQQTTTSWHGIIHAVSGVVFLLLLLVAPHVVARCLRESPHWAALARPSVLLGIAIDLTVIAYIALDGKTAPATRREPSCCSRLPGSPCLRFEYCGSAHARPSDSWLETRNPGRKHTDRATAAAAPRG
jgi:hypothetical protein